MNNWTALHCHSHYSLLDGLTKPESMAKRAKSLGHKSIALTDHGTISGSISFNKACVAEEIKPIIGCEFYICNQSALIHDKTNSKNSHLCVLAKNISGWSELIKLSSLSNNKDYFYYKPRLSLEDFAPYSKNLIAFSGHPGTQLARCIFPDEAYKCSSPEEARALIKDDWFEESKKLCSKHQDIFGKENFFIEIQLFDKDNLHCSVVLAECLRKLSKETGIKAIATPDAHYAKQEDASDQRIILCASMETTLSKVRSSLDKHEDFGLSSFFKSNRYYIPSTEEILALHEPEELKNCLLIEEMCENYSLTKKSVLPSFECPESKNEHDYLRELCRNGWKEKFSDLEKDSSKFENYVARIKNELSVIGDAGLEGYFLIVQDYCNWARKQGWLTGRGRGSGAGCMVSYLLGITQVDPIEHNLVFERFYNAGRNVPGHVSLPDIDCDFPITKRDKVIDYIKSKYNEENVSQMITYSRMQGRGALKDVLRAHGFSFDESNAITKNIPDEAEISEQLQEMKEDGGESSIIGWALENIPSKLKDYCQIDEQGNITGKLSKEFAQAIRLEGTKRSQGKHAAGIVISHTPLKDICPMIYDKKNKQMIAGLEMSDLESIGLVKFDILGVAVLDKIMGCINLLKGKENE